MPKPLKPLLIVFGILVFAGIFALLWNQFLRPADDEIANNASSAAGTVSQSAETGSGQSATAGDQPASAAADAGADSAGKTDTLAAMTPDSGTGSAPSAPSPGETTAAPGVPPGAPDAQPSFDIVRVEPSGDTVVAGRSAPGAVIELLSNGSVVATTTADAAGEFVLVLDQPLAAGGHDLALRTSGGEGVSIYSKTNVAVAVPQDATGEVLVVMSKPGAASEILAKPDEAATVAPDRETAATGETVIAVAPIADTPLGRTQTEAAPTAPETSPQPQMSETASGEKPAGSPDARVADGGQAAAESVSAAPVPLGVDAVEVEGDKLYAAGTASPGELIRVYIDDEPTGEATATGDGRWLLETEAKVPAGTVIVRADQLAPGGMKVVARAEVPFTKRVDMAVLIPTASGGAPAGAAAAGELPKPNAVIIRRGDNLWTISRRTYGRGIRYTTIYTANKDQILNPHRIYPGQVFTLPVGDKAWTQ